jgi:hypothetical protein
VDDVAACYGAIVNAAFSGQLSGAV